MQTFNSRRGLLTVISSFASLSAITSVITSFWGKIKYSE